MVRDTRVPGAAGESAELSVQIDGDESEPLRILLVSRPQGNSVRVREWIGGTGPRTRVLAPGELYAEIERAAHARRRVSEELYRVRQWLDGIV